MRKVTVKSNKEQTVYQALLDIGVSKGICVKLRKRMGLVQTGMQFEGEDNGCFQLANLRLVDMVSKNQIFWYFLEDEDRPNVPKLELPLHFVYEDEDLAVIDKPHSLAVIPTKNHYGRSLMNVLASYWGDFVYRPVNRLDRDTCGLMIVAKNQQVHSVLSLGHIERRYYALVEGVFSGHMVIENNIGVVECMKRGVMADGKYAKTEVWSVQTFADYTLVELKLYTGRTHQIRVHMAYIGHPLCCDKLYNDNACDDVVLPNGGLLKTQALQSKSIEFVHPMKGEKMCFELPCAWL